jgi:hypothetical protein
MSSYPPPPSPPGPPFGPGGVGHRLEEAIELIEMELKHAAAYVNDAVIPQVRAESITAMRKVSDTLRNLADRMEQRNQPRGPKAG